MNGLVFYLFLAFRDRYIQVKGGVKWYLKVQENVQKGTKRDTFTWINRLASEFESCIVHHKNHTEKCGSFFAFVANLLDIVWKSDEKSG